MARRLLTWAGRLVGVGGLTLQFIISMQAFLADGRDLPGALGQFFSYYTILTNIVLVLIYLSEATSACWLAVFRRPDVRAAMAANIALVGLYVLFVLRFLNELQGLFLLADYLLHYVTPVIYLLWWLLGPHGGVGFRQLPLMLAPTVVYFVYAMARGAWVAEYPYPFMNALENGYPSVLLGALQMTVFLGVLMLVVIGIDHLLARRDVVPND
jgi:hypothetical protein